MVGCYTESQIGGVAAWRGSGAFSMKVAVYARVSTQVGQSPEMQVAEVREYCKRRGWEIAGEYVDVGVSGAKERRPQLDRLQADCRKRRVDAVVGLSLRPLRAEPATACHPTGGLCSASLPASRSSSAS